MEENNICLICVYVGKMPSIFPLWLKSCGYNDNFDFLLVTDYDLSEYEIPSNVKIANHTLADVKSIADEKLNMDTCLKKPYKLCDFKPVYGILFDNYLENYNYWGHCDLDLLWGDLSKFLDYSKIEKYDCVEAYGCLTIYKNNEEVNNRYKLDGAKQGNTYIDAFLKSDFLAFDEGGMMEVYEWNNFSKLSKSEIIFHLDRRYKRARKLHGKNRKHQVLYWQDGKVFYAYKKLFNKIKTVEFACAHYLQDNYDLKDVDIKNFNSFFITRDGMKAKTSADVTISDIKKFNPYISKKFEDNEFKYSTLTRVIQFIYRSWVWQNVFGKITKAMRKSKFGIKAFRKINDFKRKKLKI